MATHSESLYHDRPFLGPDSGAAGGGSPPEREAPPPLPEQPEAVGVEQAPMSMPVTVEPPPRSGPPALPVQSPRPIDWSSVSRELGVQVLDAGDPQRQVAANRAMDRLSLRNKLDTVRGWLLTYDEAADDLEEPVVVEDGEDLSPAVVADMERDENIRAQRIREEREELGLPGERLQQAAAQVIRVSMERDGKFDGLAQAMLEGDGLQRQYEYARLRCERGGEPPSLLKPSEWLAYQGTKLVHWVRDDLGLRFKLGVWDEKLADKGGLGFLAAMAKAAIRLPGWVRTQVTGRRDGSPLWDKKLAGRWGGTGMLPALGKMLLKAPGRLMRWVGGALEKPFTSADVKAKRKEIAEYARGMREASARGIHARPTPGQIRGLTELDLLTERLEAASYLDELETLQQQEMTAQAAEQGGLAGMMEGLVDWQGLGRERKRPSFWVGVGSVLSFLAGPIGVTVGGVALLATVAARRSARRRAFLEQEQGMLRILDELELAEGKNVLRLDRGSEEPLEFEVMGIMPSTQGVMLVHEESKQVVPITMEELSRLQNRGIFTIVKR